VKAQALLALDQPGAARDALTELASSAIEDGELALDLAELALGADDPKLAARWIEVARKAEPDLEADALHLLGRVHEATEDRAAMIAAWLQVLKLDHDAPPGPLTVSEDQLEKIALAALAELPADIRERLEKVPIL